MENITEVIKKHKGLIVFLGVCGVVFLFFYILISVTNYRGILPFGPIRHMAEIIEAAEEVKETKPLFERQAKEAYGPNTKIKIKRPKVVLGGDAIFDFLIFNEWRSYGEAQGTITIGNKKYDATFFTRGRNAPYFVSTVAYDKIAKEVIDNLPLKQSAIKKITVSTDYTGQGIDGLPPSINSLEDLRYSNSINIADSTLIITIDTTEEIDKELFKDKAIRLGGYFISTDWAIGKYYIGVRIENSAKQSSFFVGYG